MEDTETLRLVAYAKIDREIYRLHMLLEELPMALKQQKEELKQKTIELSQLQTEISQWQTQQRTLEEEEQRQADLATTRKIQLSTIHNMKEYQAALKEIEDASKRGKERDATLATLKEQLDTATTTLATLSEAHAHITAEVAQKEAQWTEERQSFQSEIAIKQRELGEARAGLSDSLLKKYTHISKLREPALAAIERGVCKECNMQLPPQQYIELQKSQSVSVCPSCQRLVYIA